MASCPYRCSLSIMFSFVKGQNDNKFGIREIFYVYSTRNLENSSITTLNIISENNRRRMKKVCERNIWNSLVLTTNHTMLMIFKSVRDVFENPFIFNRMRSVQLACFTSMLSRMILSVSYRSLVPFGILTTHFNRCLLLSHDPASSFSLDTPAFGFHYALKGNLSAHNLGSKDSCTCSLRNPITSSSCGQDQIQQQQPKLEKRLVCLFR